MSAQTALINGRDRSYLEILEEAWRCHLALRESNAPTVISLFAGCGGSSLGFSMAGYRELMAVERDDNAVDTFRLNFPEVPIYHGNISGLEIELILKRCNLKVGQLDTLDGSPPCQGFSTAGKRIFDDPRNSLFKEYARILKGLQPKTFVMENVSGMIKGKMKLIFAEILRELKSCGYQVRAWLLNAKHYNVPQSRERVIFIGIRQDLPFDSTYPETQSNVLTVRQAFTNLSETVQDQSTAHVWVDEIARQTKWVNVAMALPPGGKLVPNVPSSIRCYWNRPMPTLQKNAMPGQPPYVRNSTIHPSQPRALSIREMARCQSFPDGFRFVDALHNGMQRIGNSVPPLFMKAIAEHLRETVLLKVTSAL